MLGAARVPMMVLGGSRWSQEACDRLARFAEKYAKIGGFDPLEQPGIRPDTEIARVAEMSCRLLA
jgi:hypothetical protein